MKSAHFVVTWLCCQFIRTLFSSAAFRQKLSKCHPMRTHSTHLALNEWEWSRLCYGLHPTPPPHPPNPNLEKCDRYQLQRNVAGPQVKYKVRGEEWGTLTSAMNTATISTTVIAPNCALSFSFINHPGNKFNPLKLNDPYRGRTAPLTSKRCILCIYSTNIGTEYFKYVI